MRQQSSGFNLSTAGGFTAILLWSATFAVARSLSEQVGSMTAASAVYLIGGVFCVLRLWLAQVPLRRLLELPHRYLLGCGFLFTLYTAVIYLAVGCARDREQLLEVALVNYLWPALTVLFSLPLLRQRASLWLLPGTVTALSGVFLVMTQGAQVSWQSFAQHLRGNPLAYALALVAAVSWAFYSNLARRWAEPGQPGGVELFMVVTGLVLVAIRGFTAEATVWTARAAGEAVALGAITALAYALWDAAMRKGNLLLVVAFSYFTPLLSTLVSCGYLRVAPAPRLWIGCALIVIGSFVTWQAVRGGDRTS